MKHSMGEIYKMITDKLNEEVAALAVVIFTTLFAFFKKLPSRVVHTYRKRKQLKGLRRGSEINTIIRRLIQFQPLYVHIIRYHNGGPYKMTVEWEALGSPCNYCTDKCANYKEILPVQEDWQEAKVTDVWNKVVISETIALDGALNIIDINNKEFDYLTKDIWNESNIHMYKEVLLKHKAKNESWTLGLSFCENYASHEQVNVAIEMASRRLRKLL